MNDKLGILLIYIGFSIIYYLVYQWGLSASLSKQSKNSLKKAWIVTWAGFTIATAVHYYLRFV